jgi:hypothetical protein
VRQAGLVAGVDKSPVRRPAVAFQHPGVVLAEHRRGLLIATPAGDPVDRDLVADKRPQPRLGLADPPAGLVRGHHRAGPHRLDQRLVGRPGTLGGPADRLNDATRSDTHPSWSSSLAILPADSPRLLLSHDASATTRGPSCAPAAPSALEVCAGWRGWTLRPQERQRPTWTS